MSAISCRAAAARATAAYESGARCGNPEAERQVQLDQQIESRATNRRHAYLAEKPLSDIGKLGECTLRLSAYSTAQRQQQQQDPNMLFFIKDTQPDIFRT